MLTFYKSVVRWACVVALRDTFLKLSSLKHVENWLVTTLILYTRVWNPIMHLRSWPIEPIMCVCVCVYWRRKDMMAMKPMPHNANAIRPLIKLCQTCLVYHRLVIYSILFIVKPKVCFLTVWHRMSALRLPSSTGKTPCCRPQWTKVNFKEPEIISYLANMYIYTLNQSKLSILVQLFWISCGLFRWIQTRDILFKVI